jgi:hypothetical protein
MADCDSVVATAALRIHTGVGEAGAECAVHAADLGWIAVLRTIAIAVLTHAVAAGAGVAGRWTDVGIAAHLLRTACHATCFVTAYNVTDALIASRVEIVVQLAGGAAAVVRDPIAIIASFVGF